MNLNHIYQGDALEVLKTLPDASCDSLVCDPPAGISFMQKSWDSDKGGRDQWIAWLEAIMREALRVLKPGAHGLVWALPRTSHWTATALENAGFEVREVVTHLFGSGFPKSLDVSKALDREAGAEREKIGERHGGAAYKLNGDNPRPWHEEQAARGGAYDVTAPATEAAKQWDGWGTALKPSSEHWILVRKPLSEKTVAKNVLAYGTGALNIDGTRIGTQSTLRPNSTAKGMFVGKQHEAQTNGSEFGRWPSNTILSHSPECTDDTCEVECAVRMLDEQSGRLSSGSRDPRNAAMAKSEALGRFERDGMNAFGASEGGASRFFYVAKPSTAERNRGLESHIAWEKQGQNLQALEGELSQLAKDTSADTLRILANLTWSTVTSGSKPTGLSRKDLTYITETVTRLITDLKTSNYSQSSVISESIQGAIKTLTGSGLNLAESAESIEKLRPTITNEETGLALGVSGAALKTLSEIMKLAKRGNFHSTVKSIELMRYLVRLVTPPNGIVLDPFAGSGTTCIAAKEEFMQFVGIELQPEYAELARKRVASTPDSLFQQAA